MSNKDYYARWLELKEEFKTALAEDVRLQELAIQSVGIKPQGTAVEVVSRVYSKYCELYNRLCDCYDQMEQAQRRPCIKQIIDSLTCRIIELKQTLELVEVFEFTYPDNAFQQLLIQPQDVEILCPFFYPFEIRKAEMQYIMDQIFAGNRLGDPPLTEEQLLELEEQKREEEERLQREKEELLAKYADEKTVYLTPAEQEAKRLLDILNGHAYNIQRMERSRIVAYGIAKKAIKDENLYLELAGLKKPPKPEHIRNAAALLIQKIYKKFMEIKRIHWREMQLKEKIGMVISSYQPPSAKAQLELVKEARRKFRRAYYEDFLKQTMKEKTRVLKLREGDIMDDITDEIRQWFEEWFQGVRVFDEFPWPDEGGSILIVKGETFTIEEYIEWRAVEEKRLKVESGNPKSADQIKAEKVAAREEKKRMAAEQKERERKKLEEYKKSRMNPDSDPGVYILIGKHHDNLKFNWLDYEIKWASYDTYDANLDVIRGHLMRLITEDVYKDIQLDLRPIADEMMRIELDILKNALRLDYENYQLKIPITQKRKKPKKIKPPKPDKITPEVMFQQLADNGIVKKYPRVTLDDFWGDRNYAAADCRAILWTPSFPPACIGDLKEQVRIRCILTLGSNCSGAQRSQLFVGPKGTGKKTLAYAVATETNSLLIDLSPFNVYNKFCGAKHQKNMFTFINKISRLMQPTVILVDNADKLFYKKVPKEEKMFDPTRLSKDFYAQIVKPLSDQDKIMIIGTATEPWLSRSGLMSKVFPSTIMIPSTDYSSISYVLTHMLMKYHGVNREFNINSAAQALRGYSMSVIIAAVNNLMTGKRMAQLYYKPLDPTELLRSVMDVENAVCMGDFENEMYRSWYLSYTPWGKRLLDYMLMLESQYILKQKADKKKKKK
ncbi:hypothetical protein PYW08_000049 [Mythimna loreyi]|uniref:Uncharacterized protein n=1 Tax=Mythimna loreyi TaxID=667449 RepID=A0ACC2RAU8_9NEOP|nr:hypothetical protein PYW08_000049 [Mythimna loreyi]